MKPLRQCFTFITLEEPHSFYPVLHALKIPALSFLINLSAFFSELITYCLPGGQHHPLICNLAAFACFIYSLSAFDGSLCFPGVSCLSLHRQLWGQTLSTHAINCFLNGALSSPNVGCYISPFLCGDIPVIYLTLLTLPFFTLVYSSLFYLDPLLDLHLSMSSFWLSINNDIFPRTQADTDIYSLPWVVFLSINFPCCFAFRNVTPLTTGVIPSLCTIRWCILFSQCYPNLGLGTG